METIRVGQTVLLKVNKDLYFRNPEQLFGYGDADTGLLQRRSRVPSLTLDRRV
jgi:hypothetical protein